MYCIYLDSEIRDDQSTIQHIIPLSLGGVDSLSIRINKDHNSFLGSKIEGPLINEMPMKLHQIHSGTKGQSRSDPVLKMQAKIEESPVSIKWSKALIDVYDPIRKKHLTGRNTISIETRISMHTRPKFLAKIALETGYYLFGKTFVEHADCFSLRKAIFCDDLSSENLDLRFYDNLHPINKEDEGAHETIKLLVEQMEGSSIILGFAQDRFIMTIGILGRFLGMINFSADLKHFPIDDDSFRLGHVLLCRDKCLYRDSLFLSIYKLNKLLNLVEIDDSDIDW